MSLLSFLGCGRPTSAPETGRHGQLMSLEYGGTHGYHAYSNIDFQAERLENGRTRIIVMVGNDRDRVFEEEGSVMDSLEAIVYAYKMYKYDGSYRPKFDVLDGDSWHLYMDFADGEHASCSGYEAAPPGKGREGLGKIDGFFSRWLDQEPAEEVALVSFRYEVHTEEGDEVFTFKKEDGRCPEIPIITQWVQRFRMISRPSKPGSPTPVPHGRMLAEVHRKSRTSLPLQKVPRIALCLNW